MSNSSLPWYKEGLKFQCTECGKCCTGSPGYVMVTQEEMEAAAQFLGISLELFKKKYVRSLNNGYALIEKKTSEGNYDCIFLQEKKCLIYPTRPKQCRTYPWWKENLNSEESWRLASHDCEGIREEAPLVPYSHIKEQLEEN